ncbi:hypothetical protein BKA70DRAFT_1243423 [Coprinopsis sp. MPI-PUGE-AT-0042]|nr:hypothetical protein BKA70DRAFT_1243423 [Coprinopsis sp. MPI-PUGE-AT-0042]
MSLTTTTHAPMQTKSSHLGTLAGDPALQTGTASGSKPTTTHQSAAPKLPAPEVHSKGNRKRPEKGKSREEQMPQLGTFGAYSSYPQYSHYYAQGYDNRAPYRNVPTPYDLDVLQQINDDCSSSGFDQEGYERMHHMQYGAGGDYYQSKQYSGGYPGIGIPTQGPYDNISASVKGEPTSANVYQASQPTTSQMTQNRAQRDSQAPNLANVEEEPEEEVQDPLTEHEDIPQRNNVPTPNATQGQAPNLQEGTPMATIKCIPSASAATLCNGAPASTSSAKHAAIASAKERDNSSSSTPIPTSTTTAYVIQGTVLQQHESSDGSSNP